MINGYIFVFSLEIKLFKENWLPETHGESIVIFIIYNMIPMEF